MKKRPFSRRNFLYLSGTTLAGAPLMAHSWQPFTGQEEPLAKDSTIQEVIDLIVKACGNPIEDTVDTVKSGDPSQEVTGIVTTFLATAEVIQKTADQGANLIITHEPTYYNHRDEIDWLKEDAVYQYKRELLEKNGIVVWRFHDYWHQHRPDGILQGFLESVGWENYEDKSRENICVIPPTPLRELAVFFKKKLGLARPFYVGDKDLECRNVGLLPGAWGGRKQMNMLSREDIEVLVVGEVAEWETCEYIRDAAFAGMKKAVIILGHAVSEEPGMKWLVGWLRPRIPAAISIGHVAAGDPFVGCSSF